MVEIHNSKWRIWSFNLYLFFSFFVVYEITTKIVMSVWIKMVDVAWEEFSHREYYPWHRMTKHDAMIYSLYIARAPCVDIEDEYVITICMAKLQWNATRYAY